ncbi:hypothetical protein BDW42DRAFT_44096 [Aspergillus taichungensis]|uniref:Uncharacterized protein n=1 Tax=Aspergillus taichungensis TaxID=482145 RepID=A0A2J5HE26_9EURO|nr:hypothetical protein BDW42DRAFT_44096 [Aspergillus taichungensis]
MSNLPERPWTEEEKYTLLTEILKKAQVPSAHLVKLIRDFHITPSWADIPLPAGRSLNSCQWAFRGMCQHVQAPPPPSYAPCPPPRHESSAPPAAPSDSVNPRKRPILPSDKPILAPRAIQPRPTTSAPPFSNESGFPALISPGSESGTARNEPPRKRGRPSKAESQRRKAVAEALGEPYPPPRRSNSHRIKVPSTPTSPSAVEPLSGSLPPSTSSRPPSVPQPELRYAPLPARRIAPTGSNDDDRARELPNPEIGSVMRELPRPAEMRHSFPSPQTLQFGRRETLSRMDTGDRAYDPLFPDRIPYADSSRRTLIHPPPRRPDDPPTTASELPIGPSLDKRTE